MKLIVVLLAMVFTTTVSANDSSQEWCSVQMKDGSLIFHIQESEGQWHDAVATSETGSDLGCTQIASNLWKSKPAARGTFSVIHCTEDSCTPMEWDWEVDYVAPITWLHWWYCGAFILLAAILAKRFI